uniref:Ubiquitin-activating enzyme SCCH domain-containing protein n=1 Tax=Kalanchoe fedtschenkoi TaxID=63787 RepID=A0A7N0VCN4_KALFE
MGSRGSEIEECHQLLGENENEKELGDNRGNQMLEMGTDGFENHVLETDGKEEDRHIVTDASSEKPRIEDLIPFAATGNTTEAGGDTYSSVAGGNNDSSSCGSNQGGSDCVISEMALGDQNSGYIEQELRLRGRQPVVYGCETMQKLFASNSLVSGMQGLGVEIECYGASRDPLEKQAAMCTMHSFPHNSDDCLTWARSEFEGLLEKIPTEVNAYLSSPSAYLTTMKNAGDAQARDMLERVIECLDKDKCEIFEDCVNWARLKFEDYFANRVKQLTCTFPEDATTSTDAPLWSPPIRFPRPLQFSVDDPCHFHFVMAASILRAETFGIPIPDWVQSQSKLADAFNNVIVPDFHPKKDAKIDSDEKATSISASSIDDAAVIDLLILRLEDCRMKLSPGFQMKPIQFKKDDDTNYHLDFIVGLANLKARNYSVPEIDRLGAKFIAGSNIPAIAESTTMGTGLVCLELYKVLGRAQACSVSGTISGTSEEINHISRSTTGADSGTSEEINYISQSTTGADSGTSEEINHASQITTGADSGNSKEINQTSQSTTGADSGTSEEINQTSQSTIGADSGTSEEINHTIQSTIGADSGTSEEINHASQNTTGVDSETSEEINHTSQSSTGAYSETSEEINHTSLSTTGAYSETSEEFNHTSQNTTGAGDHNHTDEVSSPSVLSTCSQSTSNGVGSAANLENEVIISESRTKDNVTNLNGDLEAPKVETSSSDENEDVSRTAVKSEVHRRPFLFFIKVPRFEEDGIREQIKMAQQELDEKTKLRDSYKVFFQTKKAVCQEFSDDLEAAKLEEKVARDNLKAKRREIDVVQVVIDKVNNAMTVEDIAGSIQNMEHIIQHETISLSEEKQLMREIKRLKHFKEQLSSSIGTQEELQEALDQKDQIRDQLKSLKKELDPIRSHVQRAETATKVAKKKCFDEFTELNKLYLEFRAADAVRQEAYMSLVSLKRELAQKNKIFRMYKDNEKAAKDYALSGDKDALHSLCVNQVETVMELWNRNDEFRREYVKCNARSTLRRLKTLDGRSPGLDAEAPSVPYVRHDRFMQLQVVTSQFPSVEQSKIQVSHLAEIVNKEPVVEFAEKEASVLSNVSSEELTQEAKEETKKTKEEEELAKKAEEIRKKEEEAKMIEQLRLEEKAKAKEALERKKRMAEKAQLRAQLRAKREAELREKEREKKLRRKEKRKSPKGAKEEVNENDFRAAPECRSEPSNGTGVSKRHHKPSHYQKVSKTNAMPLPLRNRARRRMQMWIWIGVSSIAAVAMGLLAFWYLPSFAERQQNLN